MVLEVPKEGKRQMKIIQKNKRFVIADDSGKVVDDAQGWGYKTEEKAKKAMWYKFKGGKQKIDQTEQDKKDFFNAHKGLDKFLYKIWENNFKEIARGEITEQDIVDDVKREFGIDLPLEYVGGLDK